jgi:hypothetical protein
VDVYVVVGATHEHNLLAGLMDKNYIHNTCKEMQIDLQSSKPSRVSARLKDERDIDVSRLQIAQMKTRNGKDVENPALTLGDISSWIDTNPTRETTDPDVAFVLKAVLESEPVQRFRVIITTRRLLETAAKAQVLHTDATYKLVWGDFPVLVLGVSDMERKFHLTALCFTSDESGEAYNVFLTTVLHEINSMNGFNKVFTHLMADCSDAITVAFREQQENGLILNRRYCYYHVKSAIEKAYAEYLDAATAVERKQVKKDLRRYIEILHHSKERVIPRRPRGRPKKMASALVRQ